MANATNTLKKVIAIKGVSHSGKSSLLQFLIVTLSRKFTVECNKNIRVNAKDEKNYDERRWAPRGDRKAVFDMDGRRVAIYTAGDTKAYVENAFEWAAKNNCVCLVMAVNTDTDYDRGAQKAFNDTVRELKLKPGDVKRITVAPIGANIFKGKVNLCIKFVATVQEILQALKNI